MPVQPPASARYCDLSVAGGAWEQSKLAAKQISNLPTNDRAMAEYNSASNIALVVAQRINDKCATSNNRMSLLDGLLTAANIKYEEVDGDFSLTNSSELKSLRSLRQKLKSMIFEINSRP